jgi:hypothetical protein
MHSTISLALTQHDFSALQEISEGNISRKVREIIENADMDTLKSHLNTNKTGLRLDLDLAKKLQELADTLGVAPGRVVRAAVEAELHTHH